MLFQLTFVTTAKLHDNLYACIVTSEFYILILSDSKGSIGTSSTYHNIEEFGKYSDYTCKMNGHPPSQKMLTLKELTLNCLKNS